MSFGGAPGVAVLGGDLSQLRRRGNRWRLRDWRLRTKLTAVLLVPLVLAGVLGALRVADSLRDAARLDSLGRQVGFTRDVGTLVHDLQHERHLTVSTILAPDTTDPAALQAQQARVDRGISVVRSVNSGAGDLAPPAAAAYRTSLDRLADLTTLRADLRAPVPGANSPGAAVDKAVGGYTDLITVLLNLDRAVLGGPEEPLADNGDALGALAVAKEQVSRQHAELLAAMLSGALSPAQQAVLRTADARFDAALDEFVEGSSAERKQRYETAVTGPAVGEWDRLLNSALNGSVQNAPLEIVPANWDFAAAETAERIRQVESGLLDDSSTEIAAAGEQAWNDAIRDAVVVAVLMSLAVLLLVLVVRSLLQPLRMLRTHAFDVADRRLPGAVQKLQNTDDTIGETTVDPVPVYSREEVGQVARAFDTVHVQAVRLAAEQAMLRATLNDIFLNLAGRSQRLVERQLKLIEKLESGEQDPEQLSNLFQLDHLATRMRRNSENLLVLAGGELRRGTERGVLVLDMLRAAVSEIAEYRRVTVRRPPAATVAGPVVTDLVHLIAELLDNAANAGPPDTTVTLASTLTEDGGLLVEITDCGTGLPPGELYAINERLASPPVVDVSVSRLSRERTASGVMPRIAAASITPTRRSFDMSWDGRTDYTA
ncbi:MAG TPA: nitrate- and nitrite sensing domain-containing protein [Pseudonocardiaceae bacterium]|nr:nitrate- and nitrite sensing domain-containing protein [Pseudonocardiaceae bacterium]